MYRVSWQSGEAEGVPEEEREEAPEASEGGAAGPRRREGVCVSERITRVQEFVKEISFVETRRFRKGWLLGHIWPTACFLMLYGGTASSLQFPVVCGSFCVRPAKLSGCDKGLCGPQSLKCRRSDSLQKKVFEPLVCQAQEVIASKSPPWLAGSRRNARQECSPVLSLWPSCNEVSNRRSGAQAPEIIPVMARHRVPRRQCLGACGYSHRQLWDLRVDRLLRTTWESWKKLLVGSGFLYSLFMTWSENQELLWHPKNILSSHSSSIGRTKMRPSLTL